VLYDDVDRQLRGEVRRVIGDVGAGGARGADADGRGGRGPFGGGGRDGGPGMFGGRGPGAVFGREATFAQVLGADGEIVLQTTAVETIGGLPEPDVDAGDIGELRERSVRIDGDRYRLVEAVGRNGAIVQVARPLDDVAGFLDTLMWVLAVAGAVALGAALLLGDQELREFADAMNEMLESIAAADLHQRRFVADASHELRTPLTSLGGNATYLARTTTLDADASEALSAVGRDIDRLTRIADGLTMLARLDSTPVTQTEPCDLGELARDAVERCARLYPNHAFELTGSTGVHLLDVELVRRIVDNLVDNAGRYTPAGTTVRLSVAAAADSVTLDVVDDGPGLDETERAQVVERFHRGSTSAGSSGTGLGLAIVDEAARALGGSFELRGAVPRGLHAHVRVRSAVAAHG
jgi:signal transduction histidine kinase